MFKLTNKSNFFKDEPSNELCMSRIKARMGWGVCPLGWALVGLRGIMNCERGWISVFTTSFTGVSKAFMGKLGTNL